MATPAQIWSTVTGAGLANGTSLADAYSHANGRIAVNALGALSQALLYTPCGGPIQLGNSWEVTKDGTSVYPITMQGRNAGDTADELFWADANGGSYNAITLTAANYWNFKYVGGKNAAGTNDGWEIPASADYCRFYRCRALDNSDYGFKATSTAAYSVFTECHSEGHSTTGNRIGFNQPYTCIRCTSYNDGYGFFQILQAAFYCIAADSTVKAFGNMASATGCVAYSPVGDAFDIDTIACQGLSLCIAVDAGGYAFSGDAARPNIPLVDCMSYNNTSGRLNNALYFVDLRPVILTANPFTNPGAQNFTLNDTAGGGADCKQINVTIPVFGQTGYPDGGAIDAIDAGGGGAGITKLAGYGGGLVG